MTAKIYQFRPETKAIEVLRIAGSRHEVWHRVGHQPTLARYPFYKLALPEKHPERVRLGVDGNPFILEGQVWKMNEVPVPIHVTVAGLFPDEERVVFHYYDHPDVLREEVSERTFKKFFTLWDLVPD